MLIGKSKESSLPSRTKDSADPAGPSQPLLPSKVLTSSRTTSFLSAFLNKNLLTALVLKEIKDAMEDGWILPSLTSNPTKFTLTRTIPMLLEIKLAKLPLPADNNGPLPALLMFRDAPNWPMLWSIDPFPLLLMPQSGPHTDQEC